jgi:diguanylate cyclase (GGDEF)-like protein
VTISQLDAALPHETLLAIITVQQEIVEADLAFDRVLDVVVRSAGRLTDSAAAVVEVHDGDDMIYRAGWGEARQHVGMKLNASQSISGLCVAKNMTLRCDDAENDGRVDRDACRRVGARSMIVTPLRYRGTPLGVLKVYSSRPHAFDESSEGVLRLLAGIIAASMHRAREHEGLTMRALHDQLTGLSNRSRLEGALEDAITAGRPFGIVFLDLDGFKRINDEQGHAAGDRVLRTVGSVLASSVRDRDLAARLGGDEFVVLLDGVRTREGAHEAVQRLQSRLHAQQISASAGSAMYPEDGTTMAELLARADAAMYADKGGR